MRSGSNVQVTGFVMEIHPWPCCFGLCVIRLAILWSISMRFNETIRQGNRKGRCRLGITHLEQISENIDRWSYEFRFRAAPFVPSECTPRGKPRFLAAKEARGSWRSIESEPDVRRVLFDTKIWSLQASADKASSFQMFHNDLQGWTIVLVADIVGIMVKHTNCKLTNFRFYFMVKNM